MIVIRIIATHIFQGVVLGAVFSGALSIDKASWCVVFLGDKVSGWIFFLGIYVSYAALWRINYDLRNSVAR